MPSLLFLIYIGLFSWGVCKSRLVQSSGLLPRYWLLFFIIKTGVACFYGYWYAGMQPIAHADTWMYHQLALKEYPLLLHAPRQFFLDLFYNNDQLPGLIFPNGYFDYLDTNLMLLLYSVFDLFSGGNYYVNTVFYSFITLFGYVFIYHTCKNILKRQPSVSTTLIIMICPSCLFWANGMHKDGLILLFIGLCCWCGSLIVVYNKISFRYWVYVILGILGMAAFRTPTALLFTSPFLCWIVLNRYRWKPQLVFPLLAILCCTVFFSSVLWLPGGGLPQKLIDRKNSFELLAGNSKLSSIPLKASIGSFAGKLPEAGYRGFLLPSIWQAGNKMEFAAAAEILVGLLIGVLAMVSRKTNKDPLVISFQWMIAFFCICDILLIGYSVPFTGAIVRYRAVPFMLLLTICSFPLFRKGLSKPRINQ